MSEKEPASKQVKVSKLSKKSQAKLEEIKQKQGFKTSEEAIAYLTGFLQNK